MNRLCLFFSRSGEVSLYRTEFCMGESSSESVRGAKSSAPGRIATFQWTKGVRALSILAVTTALASHDRSVAPRLEGQRGSFASWLDGVLSKEPGWVVDMFGNHIQGTPAVRRLFVRSNPGGKRPGPVAVSFAPSVLHGQIKIYLDGKHVNDSDGLRQMLKELMEGTDRKDP
jgi:hypothetical protein